MRNMGDVHRSAAFCYALVLGALGIKSFSASLGRGPQSPEGKTTTLTFLFLPDSVCA